ncbi:terpene synthase family protein [Streptomyces sp. 3N207]|uniref:terpene synthase family protein n=1 Tax=Streptomyces sp. 3N207 TaxID=3457417 RepID=UPI003FCFDCA7
MTAHAHAPGPEVSTPTDFLATPALYCPFPSRLNPLADEATEASRHWAQGVGLLADPVAEARFRSAAFGRLAGRASPNSEFDMVALLTDWLTWITLIDDHCDLQDEDDAPQETLVLIARVLRITAAPKPQDISAECPFEHALRDLIDRLRRVCRPEHAARVQHELVNSLLGITWETATRASPHALTPDEYLDMRCTGAPNALASALACVAEDASPADDAYYRPDVRAMTRSAVAQVTLANDLFSVGREAGAGSFNLVSLLMREDGESRETAMSRVIDLHNREVRRYLALERASKQDADPRLLRYLNTLRTGMRGHLDWMQEILRYRT